MLSAEPATGLKCRIPADTDAAIRISQVLQLASLVQLAQQQVQHLQPKQPKLCPKLHGLPCTCHMCVPDLLSPQGQLIPSGPAHPLIPSGLAH